MLLRFFFYELQVASLSSVPGGGTDPPLPCPLCWLWVPTEHLRDVGSSQGQEAAAEPKTVRKHYWPKISNLLNTKLKNEV